MKAKFRPIRVSDFYDIDLQERHRWILPAALSNPLYLARLSEDPYSFTMEADGAVRAICGISRENGAWAFLCGDMKPYMLKLTRYIRAMRDIYVLSGHPFMEVDPTNPDAVRWAKALGARPVKRGQGATLERWVYEAP